MTIEESIQTPHAKSLLGRTALVTGAGQGIGRGIAQCLARSGANVVLVDQASERVAPTVAEIESYGVQALGIIADVSVASDYDEMVKKTLALLAKIIILFNNDRRLVGNNKAPRSEHEAERLYV